MKILAFFLPFFCLVACSYGQGPGDAGVDAGMDDGESGTDRGDMIVYPDGITLRIPQGFELCNMNGLWNQLQEPLFKYRASVLVGDWSLPVDRDRVEIDLIGRVLTSPDGAEAAVLGPGEFRFWRDDWGPGYPVYCIYHYRQPFQASAGEFEVNFGFYLECQEGAVWQMPDNLGPGPYPCDRLAENTPGHVSATAANGDQIEFDYYYYEGCEKTVGAGICPTYYGDPSRGRFQSTSGVRETTDYYGLALSCIHHGFPATFMMVFDHPLDGIHRLVLDDQVHPAEMRYLDADLSPVSTQTQTVVNITYD